jgi:hypothetical protein
MGWVYVGDMPLGKQLQGHADAVTSTDLDDPDFLAMLASQVSDMLEDIVRTRRCDRRVDLLGDFWLNSGMLEAGPCEPVSAPAVAFSLPSVGHPQIVGTWERLFLSTYEPFASIHPCFTVDSRKLQKWTMRIASECSAKRLVGTNIVHYWYSKRTFFDELAEKKQKICLTADDLLISNYEEFLPQLAAEYAVKRAFDEGSMSMGPSTSIYVQRSVELPHPIDIAALTEKLAHERFRVGSEVFLYKDLTATNAFSLVVVAGTVALLVAEVHRLLVWIAKMICEADLDGNEPICEYCRAIEFLDQQLESVGSVRTTAFMRESRSRRAFAPKNWQHAKAPIDSGGLIRSMASQFLPHDD